MFDPAAARRLMVDGQIRTYGITDAALIDAMLAVPRERFVAPDRAELAYLDADIPLGKGRALLRPMVFARLVQAAGIGRNDRLLDVGCATGYSTAVLVGLAGAIVALEEDPDFAGEAKATLAALGADQARVEVGPLTAGWPPGAPYDVIFVNGAVDVLPEAFARQLGTGGRVAAIGGRSPAQHGMIYRVVEGRLVGRPVFDGPARLLPGFAAPPQFVF
jgi:protein-L-isoaspartate(D-aspartate) O-methyltransferase